MSIFVLVIVIFLSALIIKVGAISLRMTGLDRETVAFQALSAFTGTGFTTSESDLLPMSTDTTGFFIR